MKNKFASALVALLVAFGLWLYVITEVSPDSELTYYDIPVKMEGETLLKERGLIITAMSSTNVDLTLSGNRIDLNELNSSNITLKADMTKIYDPGVHEIGYTISFPGNVAGNAFTRENQYPDSISVTVERLSRKEIPVEVKYAGEAEDGYVIRRGDILMDTEAIVVSGPASVVERIEKAVISIDLTGQTESISQNYRYTLCDAEGNGVDSEMITVNTEEVHVDLIIQRYKMVELVVTLIAGGGADVTNVVVDIDPETIQLSGSDAALEQVGDTLNLGTINLADYETSTQLIFQIPTYEGVTNDNARSDATVDIRFDGLTTKEITIEEFKTSNVPEGYVAEVVTEKLVVKVRGTTDLVNRLTANDITATVDFANQEVGVSTYRVSISFSESFASLGVLGKPSVTASLQVEEAAE